MTHNHHENLSMMDAVTTKYGKTTFVTVSRTLAIILVVIFFICLLATGLLVYSFSSTCSTKNQQQNTTMEVSDNLIITKSTAVAASNCNYNLNTEKSNVDLRTETPSITTTNEPTGAAAATISSEATGFKTTQHQIAGGNDMDLRLPKNILPHSYKLHLIPFIEVGNFTFHGRVEILINVTENSNQITLHADTLTIENVGLMNMKNESISVKDVKLIKKKEFLIIDVDGILIKNRQYLINIVFKGVLNDMLEGFYRSSYVENNTTRWIAATQFQATEARKAFPCFDEPSFKAKFQINIARLMTMSSISNMRRITSSKVEGLPDYIWDHYEESFRMSTYLVAFVVSDFKYINNGNFSVWARPSALSQANYSIEIAPKILKFYENFFGIKYPLPKLDMVAIPDFSAGAMENWGLITYREAVLLYSEGTSSKASMERIAHVVAHELAHQWFGNLVTPMWWEDLWLNEGFATYVEFLGTNAVNPKWKDLDLFLVSELHQALNLDSLKSSHPISVKVNDPDEVDEIFDRISYSKGASIIRMMQHFLGDEVFRKGLNKYLNNRVYGNAEQDDLWQTLTEQSQDTKVLPVNTTVKDIMDTWTLQTGYPVITAQKGNGGSLIIEQERFLLERNGPTPDKTLWWVPVTILDSQSNKNTVWLKKEVKIALNNVVSSESTWFLVNINQNGYYRVNYNIENWKALFNQLHLKSHQEILPRNRAQIIDDAMKLAFAGYLSYDIALNCTLYLIKEREYVPWKAALTNLEFLRSMFIRSGHFDKFKLYMLSLLQNFYNELTFQESPNEEPTTVLNRMEIIHQACKLGLKDCVLQAVQQFQNWRNSANPDKENFINPDLRETVYCTAISDGGQEEWDFAWNRYLKSNVATDKEILLNSLACSKEVWILNRYLEWSLSEQSEIRKHDTARVFAAVSQNPVGHDVVYRFLKINWKRITNYLGPSSMSLSSIIKTSTSKFNSDEEVNDFKLFIEKVRDETGITNRTAQQAIEQAQANTKWMSNYFNIVRNWLENARLLINN